MLFISHRYFIHIWYCHLNFGLAVVLQCLYGFLLIAARKVRVKINIPVKAELPPE